MKTDEIKLALIDDHDLFREGMQSIIARMKKVDLVFETAHGEELLATLEKTSIDVILMDLEMDKMDGAELSEIVLNRFPDTRIIILTMHDNERMIAYMMESGVHGYLIKNTRKEELEKAIHQVYENGFYFNSKTSQALLKGLKSHKKVRPAFNSLNTLTTREMEVLDLICKEQSNQEIADTLFISKRTVEGHRQSLLAKFQVKNTAGLVLKAIKENIISI